LQYLYCELYTELRRSMIGLLFKIIIFLFVVTDAFLIGKILLVGKNIQILNPKGIIAFQEKDLLLLAISLMLLVVIPVFIWAFYVATKYHANNSKATYAPDWDHSTKLQLFLWGFPSLIIVILCVINWAAAHKLDPHNALPSTVRPITIQVVALQWKWLFIYPEQRIATVNYVEFPDKTPIIFEVTSSDAPMNSFWIPQLGGQIYAMSGMATQTHLMADGPGEYRGSSAEISGAGFAGMTFIAKSTSLKDFNTWVARVKQPSNILNIKEFNVLAKPSEDVPVTYYSSTENNLYTTIVTKYMAHPTIVPRKDHSSGSQQNMQNMQM